MLDYATIVFAAATGFCVLTTAIIAAAIALNMILACCMHIAAWLMHSIPTRALPRPIDAASEDASPHTASGRPLTATPRAPASPLPASRPEGYEADTGVSPGCNSPTDASGILEGRKSPMPGLSLVANDAHARALHSHFDPHLAPPTFGDEAVGSDTDPGAGVYPHGSQRTEPPLMRRACDAGVAVL